MKISNAVLYVFYALYIFSLFLPGVIYQITPNQAEGMNVFYGYDVLTVGATKFIATGIHTQDFGAALMAPLISAWMALFMWASVATLAWCANVLALAVLLLKGHSLRWSRWLALSAPIFGLSAFFYHEQIFLFAKMYVDHLGIGYYVWELSLVVLAISIWLKVFETRQSVTVATKM